MECNHSNSCVLFAILFFCLFFQGLSANNFISDLIFESKHAAGRSLLQAKTPCPVNFEFQNYTIISSKCKGPNYPHDICCAAFKEFACPFAEQLNDLTNDCATTMFSYINLSGRYPPGLFANECKEGKMGLECPAQAPSQMANEKSSQMPFSPSPVLILTGGFLVFLMHLL